MKQIITTLTFVCGMGIASLAPQNALASIVSPNGALTDLGVFAAGSYNITGSGTVDLLGGGSFLMQPDGLPVSSVTSPRYSYFNPTGSFTADGLLGPAGLNAKIGSLIGTFSATPTSSTDWFLIGYQTQVTLGTSGHIYASVNDTFYPNNTGFFEANVSSVPIPAAVWLFGSALAGIGVFGRSKKTV
jgi:hypothetical protein